MTIISHRHQNCMFAIQIEVDTVFFPTFIKAKLKSQAIKKILSTRLNGKGVEDQMRLFLNEEIIFSGETL